jgi:uracil phosphoribosyltransferase
LQPVVLCSILRAGLALHSGFMSIFDDAENGFVSAYRHHYDRTINLKFLVEYQAAPSFAHKKFNFNRSMLATGQSLVAVF